jgi:hypothetical protein
MARSRRFENSYSSAINFSTLSLRSCCSVERSKSMDQCPFHIGVVEARFALGKPPRKPPECAPCSTLEVFYSSPLFCGAVNEYDYRPILLAYSGQPSNNPSAHSGEYPLDLTFSPQDEEFRAEVRAFLEQNLPEGIRERAHHSFMHVPKEDAREWQTTLYEKGWVAPSWPHEYGGPGWKPFSGSFLRKRVRRPIVHVLVPLDSTWLAR